VLALLCGVVLVVGSSLPVEHTASATRVVQGDPDAVWRVVTDVRAFPAWRVDVDSTTQLDARGGLPVWRETGHTGSMTFEVLELERPDRLVTRIADEGLPFGGTWTYELQSTADGTRVTLTEDGLIHSVVFRFFSRFVLGYDETMLRYLDALEARMSELTATS
jgi:uncharacterized protein YndB with AHSA1/START domain